jgi:xanthine dehydrogenase accessory factor
VIVRGGGDIATGTIYRLMKCGFNVVVLEVEHPTAIRRTVSFAQAVFDGETTVEDLQAVRIESIEDIWASINGKKIPLLIDSLGGAIEVLKPEIVVDATIAKRNIGTYMSMAPIVIGLGPGFSAGEDVHAVIETNRGHNLGRVIYKGSAEPNTGNPGIIEGYGKERIIRSTSQGRIKTIAKIGDLVKAGQVVAYIEQVPVLSPLDGVLRGLIQDGTIVENQYKIGDVDPRGKREYCFTISDKARSVAGGVLEAALHLREA